MTEENKNRLKRGLLAHFRAGLSLNGNTPGTSLVMTSATAGLTLAQHEDLTAEEHTELKKGLKHLLNQGLPITAGRALTKASAKAGLALTKTALTPEERANLEEGLTMLFEQGSKETSGTAHKEASATAAQALMELERKKQLTARFQNFIS